MRTKKYISMVVAGFLSCTALLAQQKQEVSVYGAGGLSTLNYDAKTGERKNGAGGDFGVGYTYSLTEKFALNTGVGIAFYNAKFSANEMTDILYGLTDPYSEEVYDFYSSISGYEEKQNVTYLNIPLMVRYYLDNANRFYISGGVKVGIPLSGSYKTTDATFVNKGYFVDLENWGTSQEFMGFGTFRNKTVDEDLDLNIACMASIEAGTKWDLNDKLVLYAGLYFDYGLNDIVKGNNDKSFIIHNHNATGAEFSNNSVLASHYAENKGQRKFTGKVVPMTLGLKMSLAFKVN